MPETHWGHMDARPTSLHGNGAADLVFTTLDPAKVTCRLCVTLLATTESLSWVDRHGDVWRVGEDGQMWTPETAPFPREYVEKKWGPLRLVDPRISPAATAALPACRSCGNTDHYCGACGGQIDA